MRRIVVVGATSSGKTALARRLAARLACPHVELDALYWTTNWTAAPIKEFRARIARALDADVWVADGNYSKVRDIVWARADTIVWLDYSLLVILWRLVRRTVRRILTGEELWASNRESVRLLLSRDSIFLWALRTFRRLRRDYSAIPRAPAWTHLTVVRLRSPLACTVWLERLSAGSEAAHA